MGARAGPGGGAMLSVPVSPDPVFVGSAYLRESLPAGNPEGDDDKVYFFFSETGKEFDYFENTIVSRIARVCKVGTGQQGCVGGHAQDVTHRWGWRGCGTTLHISIPQFLGTQEVTSTHRRPLWVNYGSQVPSPRLWLEPTAPASPVGGSHPSPSPLLPHQRGHQPPTPLGSCFPSPGQAASLVAPQHRGCSPGASAPLHGWTDPCSAPPAPWGSPPPGGRGIVR